MTINIEITQLPDAQALAGIHAACFEKGWDVQALSDLLAIAGTTAFVVRDKGFGLIRYLGDEAEILTLAVLAPYRKQGIGKAIVLCMLKEAKAQGVKAVFLEVRPTNLAAQKLYRNNGFTVIARRKAYYPHAQGMSEDAIVMRYGLEK